jgi:hypothetical protein
MTEFAQHPHTGPRDPLTRLPDPVPGSARRSTRIDMLRVEGAADSLVLRGQGHEYEVNARVDPRGWTLVEATATPRVLPWPECPQAVPSGQRVAGRSLRSLREDVREDFVGTSTCTHLNDQFRSLADAALLGEVVIACRR